MNLPPPDPTIPMPYNGLPGVPQMPDMRGNHITLQEVSSLWQESVGGDVHQGQTLRTPGESDSFSGHPVVKPHQVAESQSGSAATAPGSADFELQGVLGEGGMGTVYLARQTSVDRDIAFKMLKKEVSQDIARRDSFLAEALVTGDLDHPNIMPVYDLGETEAGELFYAMKQVRGKSWQSVIAETGLRENLEILQNVADAIAFAHSRGVIHRDLKPENIMIGDFGEVVVMDWGLAVAVAPEGKAAILTEKIACAGTPAYMAPEMAMGEKDKIGTHSDIYLLGGLLFTIVTGAPPHAGVDTMNCLYNAACNEIQACDLGDGLIRIALKAMATDPADRYASVKEFQQALRDYEDHRQSILLTDRAKADLAKARNMGSYQMFARALFGFQEARQMWGGNREARQGQNETRYAYGECALQHGDFDLASSVLDRSQSDQAALLDRIRAAQDAREARRRHLRLLTGVSVAATAIVLVWLGVMYYRAERDRQALVKSQQERELAEKQAQLATRQADTEAKRAAVEQTRANALAAEMKQKELRRHDEDAWAMLGLEDSAISPAQQLTNLRAYVETTQTEEFRLLAEEAIRFRVENLEDLQQNWVDHQSWIQLQGSLETASPHERKEQLRQYISTARTNELIAAAQARLAMLENDDTNSRPEPATAPPDPASSTPNREDRHREEALRQYQLLMARNELRNPAGTQHNRHWKHYLASNTATVKPAPEGNAAWRLSLQEDLLQEIKRPKDAGAHVLVAMRIYIDLLPPEGDQTGLPFFLDPKAFHEGKPGGLLYRPNEEKAWFVMANVFDIAPETDSFPFGVGMANGPSSPAFHRAYLYADDLLVIWLRDKQDAQRLLAVYQEADPRTAKRIKHK